MGVLRSDLFTGQANSDLEDCAASHVFNFFKGKPANEARFEAINRIREALRRLGYPTGKDRAGEYGDDTARAVLAYKGPPRNILGPGQRTPDAVVGRQTIVRLDEDLRASGLGGELPTPPAPPTTGRQFWGFQLTTLTRVDAYMLTLQSLDQLEYAHFKFEPRRITSFIAEISGYTGANRFLHPTLFLTEKVQMADFAGSSCDIALRRDQGTGGMLSGSLRLTTGRGVGGTGEVPPYGEATNDGLWRLTGSLSGPFEFPGISAAPSKVNAGHVHHASQRT